MGSVGQHPGVGRVRYLTPKSEVRGGLLEGEALGRPLLVTSVHDQDPAEAEVMRRHGGVEALGSGRPPTVEDQRKPSIRGQPLRVEQPLGPIHVYRVERGVLRRD